MSPQGADLSTARYGQRSTPRWIWIVVATVLIGGGVAWAWWAASGQSGKPVNAKVQSYEVTSDHATKLTLQVYARDGHAARCDVYAQAADHSTVGERAVHLAASEREKYTVTAVITTERRAVTGQVRNCRLAD